MKKLRTMLPLMLLFAGGLAVTKSCADTSQPRDFNRKSSLEIVAPGNPSAEFLQLADRHASLILQASPEWSTLMGVSDDIGGVGYSRRLTDYSAQGNQKMFDLNRFLLQELKQVDPTQLSGTAAVTYAVMLEAYEIAARQNAHRLGSASLLSANPPYLVNQLFSPHTDLPRLFIGQHPINNPDQIAGYMKRLDEFGRVLDQLGSGLNGDAKRGVLPPRFALEAVAKSCRSFIAVPVSESPILTAFVTKLDALNDLADSRRTAAVATVKRTLAEQVYPAYARYADKIESLLPQASQHAGIWRLPNGDELYQIALDAYGANGLGAEEIHQIGLREVARIHAEMNQILDAAGYPPGELAERMRDLAKDPQNLVPNEPVAKEQLLKELAAYVDGVMALAPQWFATLPPQAIEVRRIPLYEQDSAAGAYYINPSLDGSRPGVFWINLKDTADWPKYTLKTLVYHEAVPGHHFQAALQQNVADMPLIRNLMFFSEYGEGWALYAEALAVEMGLYTDDPLGNLGRLRAEVYRAARLVVDTGIHHKRWSREQAIDWMVEATGENQAAIAREIERYAVWPGQATSYKLGMIRFQRLRRYAEDTLGPKFDLRKFHDVVLLDGSMPMPVLEQRVKAWVSAYDKKT